MRKAYIQPEAELLSLALLEDFLTGSTDEPTDEDVTVGGGSEEGGATDGWEGDGTVTPGTGGTQPGGDEWEDDSNEWT